MRQQLHKFAVKMLVTTHVLAFGAAFANAQPSDETTLREYAQMDAKGQMALILDARHGLIEEFKHNDIDRAFCIAGLFGESPEGDRQWSNIKDILNQAVSRKMPFSVEAILSHTITSRYCPS